MAFRTGTKNLKFHDSIVTLWLYKVVKLEKCIAKRCGCPVFRAHSLARALHYDLFLNFKPRVPNFLKI